MRAVPQKVVALGQLTNCTAHKTLTIQWQNIKLSCLFPPQILKFFEPVRHAIRQVV